MFRLDAACLLFISQLQLSIPQLQLSTVLTVCPLFFFKLVLVWLYVGVWVVSCGSWFWPCADHSPDKFLTLPGFIGSVQYLLLQCMLELS